MAGNYAFDRWCDRATTLIKYKPDRKYAYYELYSHMIDKYEDLVASGMDQSEAAAKVVKSMGDAGQIAEELARVHRPFWGYVLTCSKVLLAACLVVFIVNAVSYFKDPTVSYSQEEFIQDYISEGDTVIYPECSDSSDGYTFTVPIARISPWDQPVDGQDSSFYFLVKSVNPLPWMGHPDVFSFHAVDNLGNYYAPTYLSRINYPDSIMHLYGGLVGDNVFAKYYVFGLNGFDSDASWVELRYDSFGRDIRLCIDLTEEVPYEEA